VYALLCAAAGVYVAVQFIASPGRSELAGMAFVLLGLPWTLAVPFLLRGGGSSAWVALIGIGASCLLNFWLLSRVGSRRR
jgi:putative flippase GtrA